MTPPQRREFFSRLQAANPHPTTELQYASPFELLVAVILSAQATDKSVNKATARLFPVANTPAQMLALGEDALRAHVQTIGLYRNKAANILKTCRLLLERHDGEVPASTAAAAKAVPTAPAQGARRKTSRTCSPRAATAARE